MDILSFSGPLRGAVADLILTIQRDEFGIPIRLQDQPDLLDIERYYQSAAGGFWVAISEQKVVGTIALFDMGEHEGALRKMFVKATHRGGDRAVGSALLGHLVAHSRLNGFTTLYLGTTSSFVAAHRFYEKNGFVQIPAEQLPKSFPRMAVDTRFYRGDPAKLGITKLPTE